MVRIIRPSADHFDQYYSVLDHIWDSPHLLLCNSVCLPAIVAIVASGLKVGVVRQLNISKQAPSEDGRVSVHAASTDNRTNISQPWS